jgi:hypothetical protein
MNKIVFTLLFIVSCFAIACNAQQINKITARCPSPNRTLYSSVAIDSTGSIVTAPCPSGTVKVANDLSASGNFQFSFTPSSTDTGRARIGDFTSGDAYIDINEGSGNTVTIAGDNINLTAPTGLIAFGVSGSPLYQFPRTITTGGTTGNQTINKAVGTVNFAAGASVITVTNSQVNGSSIIFAVSRSGDVTCTNIRSVVPTLGSFVITLNAACTTETSVGFLVTN